MQKRIIGTASSHSTISLAAKQVDLSSLADVEVSSELPDFPIEAALLPGFNQGWRASEPGLQTIRLLFKQPQQINSIQLEFTEALVSRTQEYLVKLIQQDGQLLTSVRQQWNFSPEGGASQSETHHFSALEVMVIELTITPDINNQQQIASLQYLRVF